MARCGALFRVTHVLSSAQQSSEHAADRITLDRHSCPRHLRRSSSCRAMGSMQLEQTSSQSRRMDLGCRQIHPRRQARLWAFRT